MKKPWPLPEFRHAIPASLLAQLSEPAAAERP